MATKNISITEAAYRRLASMKRENESFSLVINRLTGTHTLLGLAGSLSESAADRLEKNIARVRREQAGAQRERIKRIREAFK